MTVKFMRIKARTALLLMVCLSVFMLFPAPGFADAVCVSKADLVLAVGTGTETYTGNADDTLIVPITVSDPETIAGAAFTIQYSSSLNVTVDSTFFDTFYNQFNELDTTGKPECIPDSIECTFPIVGQTITVTIPPKVGDQQYPQPLLTKRKDDGTTVSHYISAARVMPAGSGGQTTIFNMRISLKDGEQPGSYPIRIIPTTLNNTEAGYNANGETIDLLVGSDLSITDPADPDAFPVVLCDDDFDSHVTSDNVTFTAVTDTDGDGLPDDWEIKYFGDLKKSDGSGDFDGDGISDSMEYKGGTDPLDDGLDQNGKNDAPTANVGPDQAVNGGVLVTLDGSGSSDSDPDDGIASYAWTQTAGTDVTLSDASNAKPTFTAPDDMSGVTLMFQLTVTDKGGLTDTATIKVSGKINSPPEKPYMKSPATSPWVSSDDIATNVSLTPTLTGGTYYDSDGDIHQKTGWQIAIIKDNTDQSFEDSFLVYDEIIDKDKADNPGLLESIIVPPMILDNSTTYICRVRYYDGKDWSDSDIYSFTTTSDGVKYGTEEAGDKGVRVEDQIGPGQCRLEGFENNGNPINLDTKKVFKSKVNKNIQIGIEAEAGYKIEKCGAIDPTDFKDKDVPRMPYGMIEFALTLPPGKDTATVTLHFTQKLPDAKNFVWWKYDPNKDEFYDYADYAQKYDGIKDAVSVSEDRMSVTLIFKDSGQGDLVKTPDGMILDPSGPGDIGDIGDVVKSSGGTCFIETMTR